MIGLVNQQVKCLSKRRWWSIRWFLSKLPPEIRRAGRDVLQTTRRRVPIGKITGGRDYKLPPLEFIIITDNIMALPSVETPRYELTLPSTDVKVKYRPFLVKRKILLMALESKEQNK